MFKKMRSILPGHSLMSHQAFMGMLMGLLVIISPLFFLPIKGFSIGIAKGFFFLIIAAVFIMVSGVQSLRRGTIVLPRNKILAFLGIILGASLLGSIISGSFGMSFFGYGFETTTWVFTAIFTSVVFIGYSVFRSYDDIAMFFSGLIIPFVLLVIFHIVRYIVGPIFGNFGVLLTTTTTFLGSWSDLAIFFGFILIFVVLTLELVSLKKVIKILLSGFAMLLVVLLACMNIRLIWEIIGLVALVTSLYLFAFAYWDRSSGDYHKDRHVPGYMIALFVVSLVCIVFGGLFQNIANRHQNISWSDTRPGVAMTVRTALGSLKHNPITGYGPNLFNAAWNNAKPPALSGNTNAFSQGIGWVPTHIASEGLLGAFAWIGFFVVLLYSVGKGLLKGFDNPIERYLWIITGVLLVYLSLLAWAYIPGSYILILFAILIGAHLRLGAILNPKADLEYSFIKDPRASFFGIIGVIVVILVGLLGAYVGLRKFVSFIHYTKAAVYTDAGKSQLANQEVQIAAAWANHDIYHADLARFALSNATQTASAAANNKDAAKQVEQALGIAVAQAQAAVSANPLFYSNYVLLGDIYRFMTSSGIDGSVDRAVKAYDDATKHNPHDATMKLSYAQLALAQKNIDDATSKIKESINMYPTASAYILQAQIQLSQNNVTAAGSSIESAIALDPYNANLVYQYGLLLFGQKQYQSAITAFSRTIAINKSIGSAYVYLGVAYEKTGDTVTANKIYDFVTKQWTDGAQAIAQVKSGIVDAPNPTAAPTVVPKTTVKTPIKPVAPIKKK